MAQETSLFDGGALVVVILILTVFIVLSALYIVADKLIAVANETARLKDSGKKATLLPSIDEYIPKSAPPYPYVGHDHYVKLKKGFNINIAGRALKTVGSFHSNTYAIKPKDFIGMTPIPKMVVEEGAEVKAGDPLFYDKTRPEIMYTAPVSGELVEIRRAEKRSIAEVVILVDKEIRYKEFQIGDYNNLSKERVMEIMLGSGIWPTLRQRPFNTVADHTDNPKGIFISTFDTAPLAPNYSFTLQGEDEAFQIGINILQKLTLGKVHLGLDASKEPPAVFMNAQGVEKHWFEGPHPAGNVGIQIHHISPINKGEVAWHIGPQEVVVLGKLFRDGRYDTSRLIALAGPVVKEPKYYKTYQGACIENLVKDQIKIDNVRFVSGNVLTGAQIETKEYLGFFDNMVSVLKEGNFYELFGWLMPSYARPSLSPTFPWSLFPDEEFEVNTNMHGEERAFVMTGQYEKVLPMDIHPLQLLKAIMARDFNQMEGLGIYEVVEEDMALCEFVCTSKADVQHILREGLDYIREQS